MDESSKNQELDERDSATSITSTFTKSLSMSTLLFIQNTTQHSVYKNQFGLVRVH